MLVHCVLLLAAAGLVVGRSGGPPTAACTSISPDPLSHGAQAQTGNGGYVVATDLVLDPANMMYNFTAGRTYDVQVRNIDGTTPLRGFMVQARNPVGDLIGTFAPTGNMQALVNCPGGAGATIGHVNSGGVDFFPETFTWMAPAGGNGFVNFRFAVVRVQVTYYANQNAAQIAAALPSPPMIVEPGTMAPMPTVAPGMLPTTVTTPDREPNDYRITLRTPDNCMPADCDLFVGIDTNEGDSDWLDIHIQGEASTWVAVGFSLSNNMFDADVVGCNVNPNTEMVDVLDTWNPANPFRTNNADADLSGIGSFSASVEGSRIVCTFARMIAGANQNDDLNLDQSLFFMYGIGTDVPAALRTFSTHRMSLFNGGNPIRPGMLINPAQDRVAVGAGASGDGLPATVTAPDREPNDYRITLRTPDDCMPANCDLFVGIDTNAGDSDWLDIHIQGEASTWVAVGFSRSNNMFDADVMGCNVNPNTEMVDVLDTWNPASPARINDADADLSGIGRLSASVEGSRIVCTFARMIAGANQNDDLDLDEPLYLMYGVGTAPASLRSFSTHRTSSFGGGNPIRPGLMINPAQDTAAVGGRPLTTRDRLTRAHGILMLIAWPVLGVIAIFFAAWMRPALPNGEWFQVHRAFMLGSLFVGAAGFLLIFVAQYNEATPGLISLGSGFGARTAHFAIGILIMLLHIVNPIISIFRCHPGTPNRWIFNLLHGTFIGLFVEVLALTNVGIGIAIFSESFSIFSNLTIFWVYLAWIVFFVAVIAGLFIIFTVLSFTSEDDDRAKLAPSVVKPLLSGNQRSSGGDKQKGVELAVPGSDKPSEPAEDKPKVPSADAPLRWAALAIFAGVTLPIMIVLLILIAI